MKSPIRSALLLVSIVAVYIGFRFVTQAGQGLNAIQNDGYAGVGGVLILLGGLVTGWMTAHKK